MESRGIIRYAALAAALVCATVSSCRRAADDLPRPVPEQTVEVGFRISLGAIGGGGSATRADYDDGRGVDYENHIDFEHGSYRFLFFDLQNRYLSSFTPSDFRPLETTAFRSHFYEVKGTVDRPLPEDFKVVALANWQSYPADFVVGETTIEQICTAVSGRYSYVPPFRLGERLIPLYGVRRCEGMTFVPGMSTNLGTIHMLRAMAKVEVVCATAGWTLDGVTLQRYNAAGYCAPKDVYEVEDYYRPDYVERLHLVGDANDAAAKNLDLERSAEGAFVAYIPEYRNLAAGSAAKAQDAAELRVRFRETGDKEYPVEFKYYTDPPAGSRLNDPFDIRRNYYYKFTITKAAEPIIEVDVYPYEQVELDPGFGLLPGSKNEETNEE